MSLNTLYSQMAVSDLFMYTNLLTLNKGVHQMHFIMFFFLHQKRVQLFHGDLKHLFIVFFIRSLSLFSMLFLIFP